MRLNPKPMIGLLLVAGLGFSCGRANNKVDGNILECGLEARNKSFAYMPVRSNSGAKIPGQQLETETLTFDHGQLSMTSQNLVTKGGCIYSRTDQTVLVRQRNADAFALLTPEDFQEKNAVVLEDLSAQKAQLIFAAVETNQRLILVLSPLGERWAPFFHVSVALTAVDHDRTVQLPDFSYQNKLSIELNSYDLQSTDLKVDVTIQDELRKTEQKNSLFLKTTLIPILL